MKQGYRGTVGLHEYGILSSCTIQMRSLCRSLRDCDLPNPSQRISQLNIPYPKYSGNPIRLATVRISTFRFRKMGTYWALINMKSSYSGSLTRIPNHSMARKEEDLAHAYVKLSCEKEYK